MRKIAMVAPGSRISRSADEFRLGSDGELQHQRYGSQTLLDHGDGAEKIGPHAIHLVHETNARHVVFVGLALYGL